MHKKRKMIIKKVLKLSVLEYYNTHLQLINPILPITMTPKEIEILAYFMSFNGTIAEDRFGTTAKNIVKSKMKLSNAGVSNYMKKLKDKGLVKDGIILHILFPDTEKQQYQFELVNIDS